MDIFRRQVVVVVLAGVWAMSYASGVGAQGTVVDQDAWPPVSVNVSVQNGVLVAQGVSMGGLGSSNRVLWRTPLARGSRATSVRHGGTTTFVQTADGRQFVIDNMTGQAVLLRENQMWRSTPGGVATVGPARPVRPETSSPPQRSAAATGPVPYAVPAAGGREFFRDGGTYEEEGLPPAHEAARDVGPPAPAPAADELHGLSAYQQALRDLMNANNVLITRLDRERQLAAVESSELPQARREVDQARQSVSVAQERVNRLASGVAESSAPSRVAVARSVMTPQQYAEFRAAQQRALDLSAAMNRKAMLLDAKLTLEEITQEQYDCEQKVLAAYQREVDRANARADEILREANHAAATQPTE